MEVSNTSRKSKILAYFDQEYEIDASSQSYNLLNPIKEIHRNLYKIGCKLDNSYKMRDLLPILLEDSNPINKDEFCGLLNEWINNKKYIYIFEGTNCENKTKFWEENIEKLWEQLKTNTGNEEGCERCKIFYNCSVSPEMKTSLSVGFTIFGILLITFFIFYKLGPIRSRIHNCLHKKKRKIENIVPEKSCELLEGSSKKGISFSENGSIALGYHSVEI
ncbi:PIR Superfamily Protein [Plasmodium malariae]|uniref:PIR Superfamily Protein n=1 Tax=Plasmodium malariae TaxID=5858 RepID=A0A1A8X0W7_PLAMA|nr:PIR Superfamily Protein [Plasmodium malariae]